MAHDILGAWMLLWTYGPIAAALWLFGSYPTALTFVLALVVVTARQHALFVVMHESWHYNVFRARKANELCGAFLCAYPLFAAYYVDRDNHWNHHRYVGTRSDPDGVLWNWDGSQRIMFFRALLTMASGMAFAARICRILRRRPDIPLPNPNVEVSELHPVANATKADWLGVATVQAIIFGIFATTLGWVWYFVLWVFPAVALYPTLGTLRGFLEHRNGRLLVYHAGRTERFVFGAFNFHLHAYHHAIPSAPWFLLPNLGERALQRSPHIIFQGSYVCELVAYFLGRSAVPHHVAGKASQPQPAGNVPFADRPTHTEQIST